MKNFTFPKNCLNILLTFFFFKFIIKMFLVLGFFKFSFGYFFLIMLHAYVTQFMAWCYHLLVIFPKILHTYAYVTWL